MAIDQHGKQLADVCLDVRGESCPYPELYTLDALKEMQSGQVLEVIADCPRSFINVPDSVKSHGHKIIAERKYGPTMYFYVRVL